MAKPHKFSAALGRLIVRCYTFVIMAVVIWSGYTAVVYLYRSVFQPAKAPATILSWQAATQKAALREPEAPGVTEPALRSPIAHYHGVDRWFQPDPRNGCLVSGCHDALPHSKDKGLRAFANLHATFMTCETCHVPADRTPMPATWMTITSGQKQGPPAILQLMTHLKALPKADGTTTQPATSLDEFSSVTVRLLREAITIVGDEPVLNYLATQIETSEPGSPVWRKAIGELTAELPNHARGEYGTKIVPADAAGEPARRDLASLANEFFSRSTDQTQRAGIVQRIHEGVNPAPQGCLPCHRGMMLDFAALGYPPERIRALTSTPIATMMQQIHQGQPFNLPLAQ